MRKKAKEKKSPAKKAAPRPSAKKEGKPKKPVLQTTFAFAEAKTPARKKPAPPPEPVIKAALPDPEPEEPEETPVKPEKKAKDKPERATATSMAGKQREISVSEFFTKNRHLLGFDNPRKALLTTVKEAVDNSLDACEEAGILPEIRVEIRPVEGIENRFRIAVTDNGPGILKSQIPKIFGKLLYGSKFHRLRQSRGQQGIGISAAGMYGQLTTGKPVEIISRPHKKKPSHLFHIQLNTRTNNPEILKDEEVEWNDVETGTKVEIELDAKYQKGKRSVDEYMSLTALANPHSKFVYIDPMGKEFVYEKSTGELPTEPLEIKPHPYGVELGMLIKMLQDTGARNLSSFLKSEFCRVGPSVAAEILKSAKLEDKNRPSRIARQEAENLYKAINATKIMAPPTNCVTPIGEALIEKSLTQNIKADLVVAVSRPPSVYRGNPFLVEAGIAYGGDLPADDLVTLYRFANRVPLLHQQSACAITEAATSIDWKGYGLQHSRGALPSGPAVIMVHMASVWVPFTSESKEAIADYPEIDKQIRLALQECGRKLSIFINKRKRDMEEWRKKSYIQTYIPHIGIALQEILGLKDKQVEKITVELTDILEKSRKG